jgi:hypothetical protein
MALLADRLADELAACGLVVISGLAGESILWPTRVLEKWENTGCSWLGTRQNISQGKQTAG